MEELARAAASDPGIVDLSRQLGLQRSMAWVQLEDLPILTVYMEWKVDPVSGLGDFEASQESMARQIQTVLRQAASSPEDAALEEAASRSEIIFDWACEDGSRGRDLRCYARLVSPGKAATAREFVKDLRDPLVLRLYTRLRERIGMKGITVWEETVASGDVMLIELYESNDLDHSFAELAKSAYELDEMTLTRTALTFGWAPGHMPALRPIYEFGSEDAD